MSDFVSACLVVALVLTVIGLIATCARLTLGPSRADRVVALDLLTVLLVAIAALAALRYEDAAYLDIGLTLALIGFLATVAFARYVGLAPSPLADDDMPDTTRTGSSEPVPGIPVVGKNISVDTPAASAPQERDSGAPDGDGGRSS